MTTTRKRQETIKKRSKTSKTKKVKSAKQSSKTYNIRVCPHPVDTSHVKIDKRELETKIQWLMDLGGDSFIRNRIMTVLLGKKKNDSIAVWFGKFTKKEHPIRTHNFTGREGKVGHWLYFDKKGKAHDSYAYMHQKPGSHQFCQTFSLIYAISIEGNEYVKALHKCLKHATRYSDYKTFGYNIRVVTQFWRHVLSIVNSTDLKKIHTKLREINDDYLKEIYNRRDGGFHVTTETKEINNDLIFDLLDQIDIYSEQIAENI